VKKESSKIVWNAEVLLVFLNQFVLSAVYNYTLK